MDTISIKKISNLDCRALIKNKIGFHYSNNVGHFPIYIQTEKLMGTLNNNERFNHL